MGTDPKTSTLAFLEISLAQPQTGIYTPVSGWVGTVLGVPCPPRAGTEAPSSHGPVVTMPPGDFLPSALGCLSDQSGDSGPLGVSGWGRRQCVAPTPPAGRSAQLLCPAPGLEVGRGGPAGKARGALGDRVAGTWRGTMQGSQWKSGGGHVGSRWELEGSGGAVADRRGPREGHIGVTCRMPHGSGRTGASGTMLGACGDHTRAYVGARGGKSWWGAPMLGSAEASCGVLGAGISPVHEGAPALRVTHPPNLSLPSCAPSHAEQRGAVCTPSGPCPRPSVAGPL